MKHNVIIPKNIKGGLVLEIIYAHFYPAGVSGTILLRLYKIPLVITEHCTGFAIHSENFIEKKKDRFVFNRAKIIIPANNDFKEVIKNYYGIKKRFKKK